MSRLTAEQKAALKAVRGGADVYSRALATTLRDLALTRPDLIEITEPRCQVDGYDQRPYCGAWLKPAGEELLGHHTTQEIAQ